MTTTLNISRLANDEIDILAILPAVKIKNLTVVNGVGSEAYLQISPDRKSFDGEVWVHKNVSHFRLIAVSEQPPSPDVLKTAAQKIAAKLP